MPLSTSYPDPAILNRLGEAAREGGRSLIAVGAAVRHRLRQHPLAEVELRVDGEARSFAKRVVNHLGATVLKPRATAERATLLLDGLTIFLTGGGEGDLTGLLRARGFTVDAVAMDLAAGGTDVFDPFGGLADLEAGRIRTIDVPADSIAADPLRLIRAVRLAAEIDAVIEPSLWEAIRENAAAIKRAPREMVTAEFRRIMLLERPSSGLRLLRDAGLSAQFFPELDQLSGVEQRQEYHHKDVFEHTLQVVDNISENTDRFPLRMVALMHDIAKPQTKRFVDGVGWTFHGHEELGARMVERIGRRLRLDKADIAYISRMVRLHMRPTQLVDEQVTDSAIRRMMSEAGDDVGDLMIMCRADITSKNPRKVQRYLSNFDRVESRIGEVEEKDRIRTFQPALTGEDIMAELGIPPGPTVGIVKKAITDAILAGRIPNDRDACMAYFREIRDDLLGEPPDAGS